MTGPRRGVRLVAFVVLGLLLSACAVPRAEQEVVRWSYVGTKVAPKWWYDLVDVPGARAKGKTGANVTIAIVDTGVQPGHEDLPAAKGVATCGADSADIRDRSGHGTQLAGIALGKDPGRATFGLAPAASLVVIKVDCGLVAAGPFTRGIDRAIEFAPDVVLIALGGYPAGPSDVAAFLRERVASKPGILFVVASVWDGVVHPLPEWTRADNVVVAAAMTLAGGNEIPFDARRGDIAAPGRDVDTADIALYPGYPMKYLMQGTSAASAILAGCAALVKEKTGLAGAQLKAALVSAAESKPDLPSKRLNCARAIP